MLKFKKIIFLWGPAVLWMLLIFVLSSRPRISVAETPFINFAIFKFLHMVEYAILFFLILRATKYSSKTTRYIFIYAFLIAVLYAISDEIHQSFVPTREGKMRDVFIDTAGIAIMYMYIKRRPNLLKIKI